MTVFRRRLSVAMGLLSTGIGVVGIVLPVLPKTQFLLLACLLFANASPQLHARLYNNRITGPFLKDIPKERE